MKTLPSIVTPWASASLISLALLSPAVFAQGAKPGDPVAAQKKVAMCIGCHGIAGYQASFPKVYKVPMISGQSAKYIASALTAYKKGDRKHPTMKGIAASLTEQDIADLAAYYEASGKNLPPKPAKGGAPSPQVTALLTKGNCASCHGADLNKPIDPTYPKLAGQHADYILASLEAYQASANPQFGRNNAIMVGQVKAFNRQELALLARHIESLGGDLKTVPQSKFK